ncbi:hypothetical protein K438DRAFT_1782505 [Mycena galopus ATCC 62051]|nr:hypothetical protein K438DRAFT_1782505 [Mycena galopus ATCC 62051]
MSRSCTPPVTVSPMRAMHTYRFDPIDRWLASVEMNTSPGLFLRSPLPEGDAMCEVYISHHLVHIYSLSYTGSWLIVSQGLTGRHYRLSLAVYHPRVADYATPDIELARFVGHADDPGAPIWVLEGTTDIPIGPVLRIGTDEEHLERRWVYDLWVLDALAIAPAPPAPRRIHRSRVAVKWVRGTNLRAYLRLFPNNPLPDPMARYQQNAPVVHPLAVSIEEQAMAPALNETVRLYTATAVQTVEFPVHVQTEALAGDEHTAEVRIIQTLMLLEQCKARLNVVEIYSFAKVLARLLFLLLPAPLSTGSRALVKEETAYLITNCALALLFVANLSQP